MKEIIEPSIFYRQLGSKNSNWKNSNVTKTGNTRAERIFQYPIPCRVCCNPKTERHHIDGNTLNNSSANIDWLCRKHHMEADGRMDKWIKRNEMRGILRRKHAETARESTIR